MPLLPVKFLSYIQLIVDAEGNVYQGFMVNGVRSGAGKLTYTELNSQIESFDGEWVDNVKTSGLSTYREYSPSTLTS